MIKAKRKIQAMKKIPWSTIGIIGLFILFVVLVMKGHANQQQAMSTSAPRIYFEGEYRIDDGEWCMIEENQHIPATQGDVTLRGRFHMSSPDGSQYIGPVKHGTPIAFFLDHVNIKVFESGKPPYELCNENPRVGSAGCGEIWLAYAIQGDMGEPIEIVIHNPHQFGNETAVDSFLSGVAYWTGSDFGEDIVSIGATQRILGLIFCLGSIVLLGIALFSTLLRIQRSKMIWLFGFLAFFAGAYLAFSAPGAYFWSEQIEVNTIVIGSSMMYYMLFVAAIIVDYSYRTKRIGKVVAAAMGVANAVFLLVPILSSVYFYDMWMIWVVVQSVANVILLGCLFKEFICAGWKKRLAYGGMILTILAFEADAIATACGWWKGGLISKYVFFFLFVSSLIVVLFIVPQNMFELKKTKDLDLQRSRLEMEKNAIEAELKESRISIMLSQIQPHFIYNTLGTIERLCLKDPQTAFELVRNFSLYLRGNFSELDSVAPIRFTKEIEHVQHYVNIEKVRFPDMTIEYQLDTSDFVLPALSVQPLVENAIKHGLMQLESGGKVVIRSYETDTHFCVEVSDNGAGFDTSQPIDKKEHVGLYNIRERLKAIVNGALLVESAVGVGTKATIIIPKEEEI